MRETGMTGLELIALERERQEAEEGWLPEDDDKLFRQELACAGACYAMPVFTSSTKFRLPENWPRDWEWKPSYDYLRWGPECEATAEQRRGRIRDLVKGGALIAAEIDRLQRKNQ
jgi:hypothetical protein